MVAMSSAAMQRRSWPWQRGAVAPAGFISAVLLMMMMLSLMLLALFFIHPSAMSNNQHHRGTMRRQLQGTTDNNHGNDIVVCSEELNAYCPSYTKCCPSYKKSQTDDTKVSITGYSCLMSYSTRVPLGPCCDHFEEEDEMGKDSLGSGCAIGYVCASPAKNIIPSSTTRLSFLPRRDERDDGSGLLPRGPHCVKEDNDSSDPLIDRRGNPIVNNYERMPRYHNCPSFAKEDLSQQPFGLPISLSASHYNGNARPRGMVAGDKDTNGDNDNDTEDHYIGQLAYYSNYGSITSYDVRNSAITSAVIGIHGSGRDAGSYLCTMMAAAAEEEKKGQSFPPKENGGARLYSLDERMAMAAAEAAIRRNTGNNRRGSTIVIAPWFLAPSDELPSSLITPSSSSSSLPFLRWSDSHPVAHTWRYGAESIPVRNNMHDTTVSRKGQATTTTSTVTVSSYRTMDIMLETLCDRSRFPNLERIVIAGHSAGGQFAQRYALTSDSWCFGYNDDDDFFGDGGSGSANNNNNNLPHVRIVAANPRSYAYFDSRRFFPNNSLEQHRSDKRSGNDDIITSFGDLELRPPTTVETSGGCQSFNEYEWGLEDNPDVPAPYVTAHLTRLLSREDGNVSELFCRYASRDVVYLSGEWDVVPLSDQHLGKDFCREDGYQGPSRRERSERFFASLRIVGKEVLESMLHTSVDGPKRSGGFCGRDAVDTVEQQVHARILARNIGHDHGLIFASDEGRKAMFGELEA